jgi:hypothetical protein
MVENNERFASDVDARKTTSKNCYCYNLILMILNAYSGSYTY